ncbi:MAG TPA: aldo/keto reductase, partial [Candidatus Cloacimonadota bacterium]|nr:aldo/keto reductase [Candidatus Cloacimonadota bacterium]
MQYREMPKSQDRLSVLGFGCMRFPTLADGKIDEAKALEMLHHAFENKVNYFDTAWPYHNEESEPLLGKFLAQIDRSKVYVATKLPCWLIQSHEDMDKYLDLQLQRLGTSYIDYYLLHALGKKSWANMKKLKVFEFLERARAAGKIRHIGFSFHDSYSVFKQICLSYDWDFCQIMLNYLDTHYQAGIRGFELAVSRGMGVIAMEPLRGGKLISPIPPEIAKIWQREDPEGDQVARATRWIWNLEGATVLL